MAAGLGFKTFANGEVLSAADVNGYLMQGILVFTNAAERTAEITSPQEGQTSYLKDTDAIQVYSGSAWVTKSASSPLTTKGDLYGYSTTDARVPVGSNGTVLTADSTNANGVVWASPAGSSDNFTLLNAGGTALTGAGTVTVSFSAKNKLVVQIDSGSSQSSADLSVRFNSDSGANYAYTALYTNTTPACGATSNPGSATQIEIGSQSNAGASVSLIMSVEGAATTGLKPLNFSNQGTYSYTGNGWYEGSSAITSVSVITTGGNWDSGTLYIYGA